MDEGAQDYLGVFAAAEQGAVLPWIGEKWGGEWHGFWLISHDDAPWLLAAFEELWDADGEGGQVAADSFPGGEYGIGLGAEELDIGAGCGSAEPLAFTGGAGDSPIQRHGALPGDPWQAGGLGFRKGAQDLVAVGFEDSAFYYDPSSCEDGSGSAGVGGIRIGAGVNYAGDSGGGEGGGAGGGAAGGGAGL